tara:strand:- start:181 stop:342 length:162 start_codon:yes stop_codon:yes gene_type:complete
MKFVLCFLIGSLSLSVSSFILFWFTFKVGYLACMLVFFASAWIANEIRKEMEV